MQEHSFLIQTKRYNCIFFEQGKYVGCHGTSTSSESIISNLLVMDKNSFGGGGSGGS